MSLLRKNFESPYYPFCLPLKTECLRAEKKPFSSLHDFPEYCQKRAHNLQRMNFRHINSHAGLWHGASPHVYSTTQRSEASAVLSIFSAPWNAAAPLFPTGLVSLFQCDLSPSCWEPNPYWFGLNLLNSVIRELYITGAPRPYIVRPVLHFQLPLCVCTSLCPECFCFSEFPNHQLIKCPFLFPSCPLRLFIIGPGGNVHSNQRDYVRESLAMLFRMETCDTEKIKSAEQGLQCKVTIEHVAAKRKVWGHYWMCDVEH